MACPLSGAGSFDTQAIGALAIFAWAFGMSYIILKVLDLTMGIRSSKEEEESGLDVSEIGIEAYPDFK